MFRWSRDCHHATMCHLWPSHRFLDRTKTKLESFLRKLSETFWEVLLFVSCSSLFLHRDRCFAQSEVRRRLAVVLSGSAAKGYTAPMVVGRMAEVMSNLLLQQFPNSTTQYCKNKSMISRISRSVKQLMTNICANQPPKHETLT